MADDPRTETRLGILGDYCSYGEAALQVMLRELDAVDPLRVMLADDERVAELIAREIDKIEGIGTVNWLQHAHAILAALRVEANRG